MNPLDLNLLKEALYLGNLTAKGIKPLSRIEYPIDVKILRIFHYLRLVVDTIKQKALNGKVVEIIIISMDQQKIDQAKELFDNKQIIHDSTSRRLLPAKEIAALIASQGIYGCKG